MTLPVLTIHKGCLSYGTTPLFQDLEINVLENDHICLIGSNGQGKSTLLKVLSGTLELDKGVFYKKPHTRIHYLPQDLEIPFGKNALEVVLESDCMDYEAATLLDALEIETSLKLENLSGGEKRRVLLARALAGNPDVLLLDEPTNHLDIKGIQWLETYLNAFKKAFIIISHDRRFLTNTSRSVVWLDRGQTRRNNKGYAYFDQWMEEIEQSDTRSLEKVQSKLRLEEHWLQRGVTARRKRNQGRLAKLQEMRHHRKQLMSSLPKSVELSAAGQTFGNQLVAELKDVQKVYEGRLTLGPISTRIFNKDRIGIVGPNGSGKTTLLKLIIGHLQPDSGKIRIGKSIEPAFFEQERNSMEPTETPWQYLCPAGGDSLLVQDTPMHVVGYLKKFLFDDKQARGAIGILSGGEKNRLQLAKILAQPSNVLVLDEPTNDLDMDTLDLLTDMLSAYKGTLILISHDRDFIDQLATVVFAIQPDGSVIESVGGYTDYENTYGALFSPKSEKVPEKKARKDEALENIKPENPAPKKISYAVKRDLELIPQQLDHIDQRLKEIETSLLDVDLYTKDFPRFQALTKELDELKEKKTSLEDRWLELSLQ